MPQARLAGGLAQHPGADRHDQPVLLGQRDEGVGHQQAALGMIPADQRLDADKAAVAGADLRLEQQRELLLRDRLAELALQHQVVPRQADLTRLEEDAVGAAACLGRMQRRIGMLDQHIGRVAVVRIDRDADRGRDRDVLRRTGDPHRTRQRLEQLARHMGDRLAAAHARQQHDELVAAEACHPVGAAHPLAQAAGQGLEQRIARGMAERVVDPLEVVEVDEQQRQPGVGGPGGDHQMLELAEQRVAVGQAGQRIVMLQVVQLVLHVAALADVAQHRHAHRRAALQRAALDQLDRNAPAVLRDQAGLDAQVLLRIEPARQPGLEFRRDQAQQRPLQQLVQRLADQRAQRRIGIDDVAVAVEDDALDAGLHEAREPFLGLEQRTLGMVVAAVVADQQIQAVAAAACVDMRRQRQLGPDHGAVGQREPLLGADRLAIALELCGGGLQPVGQIRGDRAGQWLADRAAFGCSRAQRLHEGPVGIAAAQRIVLAVGHQHRGAVGQPAQPVALPAEGRLGRLRRTDLAHQRQRLAGWCAGWPGQVQLQPAPGRRRQGLDRSVAPVGQRREQRLDAGRIERESGACQHLPAQVEHHRRQAEQVGGRQGSLEFRGDRAGHVENDEIAPHPGGIRAGPVHHIGHAPVRSG